MSVNSLQRKKPSEQMAEYVAGRNRVNVMPHQTTANYGQPVSQGQARVAEMARQKKQQQIGVPVAPQTPAEIVGYQQARGQAAPQQGGTVLTQEQVLANNINDIIKRMNEIMSQPGNLMSPSASPYYNIYMEQYRKNAEAAEANAFARSVASSGGYGSSYATMAGQQAYRDTMEGFTELTPSLVQTKGQAMSDLMTQYQLAKGLKDQLDVEAEKADTAGNVTIRLADGTEVEVTETAREIFNTVLNNNMWDGTNVESLKTRLYNMGYKQEDIDATVGMLQKEMEAQKTDVQNANREALELGMEDLAKVDLTPYGYDEKEISKMSEEERGQKAKEALLDAAVSMVKSEQLSKTDFANIVRKDMIAGADEILKRNDKYALRDLAKYVIALDDYQTEGVLSSDFKTQIMVELAKRLRNIKEYKKAVDDYESLKKRADEEDARGLFEVGLTGLGSNFKNEEQREAFMKLIEIEERTRGKA